MRSSGDVGPGPQELKPHDPGGRSAYDPYDCGPAMIRSGMWEPKVWGSNHGLPSYAQALKDHGKLSMNLSELEERVANNETNRLY